MTLRRFAALISLSLALVACDELLKTESRPDPAAKQKLAALEHDALFETEIMIGRVEVMQDQTHRGLEILGVSAPAIRGAEATSEREPYRRLYDAVERYNDLRQVACARKIARGELCGSAPYLPLWYAGRARPDTSPSGLKTMAEDMQGQMMPLWDTVCAKAKAKSGDEHLCAIE